MLAIRGRQDESLHASEQPAVHNRPPRDRTEPVRRLRARAVALVVRERAREPRRGDLVPGRCVEHRLADDIAESQIGSVSVIFIGAGHAIDGALQVVERVVLPPASQEPRLRGSGPSSTPDETINPVERCAVRRSPLHDGLIVAQVTLSIVLLGASGLIVQSFVRVQQGPGFDPDAIVVLRLRPSLVGFTHERAWAFHRAVVDRLEALPGVVAASPAMATPPRRWQPSQPVLLAGDPGDPARAYRVSTTYVGARYFKTLGVHVIDGREFDDRDTATSPCSVIVNETLARHFWPRGGAIGSSVRIGADGPVLRGADRCEVVGVVQDLQWVSALEQPAPVAYLNYWQQTRDRSVTQESRTHVRVSGDAAAMLPAIRQAIAGVDPDVPIQWGAVLGRTLDSEFADVRTARTMLVLFGVLALGLSMIGLYASLAFSIAQRTREIALRMALGASRVDVGRLVFRRGFGLVAIGVGTGLAACVSGGPFLSHLLYGVSPRDPMALSIAPVVLMLIAALAISLPARRAMRQNPVDALRQE